MSVPSAKRTKTPEKFIVSLAAEKLLNYSFLITESKKTFPDNYPPEPKDPLKKSLWVAVCRKRDVAKAMIYEIREYTVLMTAKVKTANAILARTANNFKARIRLEEEALEYAYTVKSMIGIVALSYHLSKRRLEFWNSLVNFFISKLKGWIKSERTRCIEAYNEHKLNQTLDDKIIDSIIEDIT